MAKTRTFIAVESSREVQAHAAGVIANFKEFSSEVRWVRPESLHFTLQFLGDLSDQEVADACERTSDACQAIEPFSLRASGIGAFPSVDRPRTIWLGVGEGSAEITELAQAIAAEMEGLGFRAENRRYVPHMTIGKANRHVTSSPLSAMLQEDSPEDAGIIMTVDTVTVFASELTREGPTYHVLARCPLGCGAT